MLFYFCLTALVALNIFKTKNNREDQTRRNNTNRPCGCLFFIVRICTHLLTPSLMRCLYLTIFNEFSIRTHHKTACGKYLFMFICINILCVYMRYSIFFFNGVGLCGRQYVLFHVYVFLLPKPFFLHACMRA